MKLTKEQNEYVFRHLSNPKKSVAIAAIAKMLIQNSSDIHLDSEEAENAALLMNIGETSEDMVIDGVSIYSKEYGPWDNKAKELNTTRGEKSIEMAESQGIVLSETAKDAIISTSKGGSLNKMGITLKIAQTMEAIKHIRWSRGEEKQPAKDITEVTEILTEELEFMLKGQEISEDVKKEIRDSMITAAQKTYVMEKSNKIRNTIKYIIYEADKQISMHDSVSVHIGESQLTNNRVTKLLSNIPDDKIDELCNEIDREFNDMDTPMAWVESNVGAIVSKWEREYVKDKNIDDVPSV